MVDTLRINDEISIPLDEIEMHAVRSQGAGGQNVNKVASAIHLRFDYQQSKALSAGVRRRIAALDDGRVSGTAIIIKSQQFRSQSRNKDAALERLRELILKALVRRKPRIPTRPTNASKARRVDAKRRLGALKKSRGPIRDD